MVHAQREQILRLLPHMERPPEATEEEWWELLLLEAPSILELALPGAEALAESEETFPSHISEENETDEMTKDALGDSLAGYSPSWQGFLRQGVASTFMFLERRCWTGWILFIRARLLPQVL